MHFLSFRTIVLLKLAESVSLGNYINKICLPIQNQFTYFLDEHFMNNVIEDRKFSVNRWVEDGAFETVWILWKIVYRSVTFHWNV